MKPIRINPAQSAETVTIFINGNPIKAYRGETVVSALLAAGKLSFRKSSRLHEPRGPLCGMGACFECLVSINGEKDQRRGSDGN